MKYSNRSSQWYSTAYRVDREIPPDALRLTMSPLPVRPMPPAPRVYVPWFKRLNIAALVTRPDAMQLSIRAIPTLKTLEAYELKESIRPWINRRDHGKHITLRSHRLGVAHA